MELEERFWGKVNWTFAEDRCWPWTAQQAGGYGRFKLKGQSVLAHRLAYELEVGEIAEGLVLDHRCRNPICVNPEHLEPVTHVENVMRGIGPTALNAQKTHCPTHGAELEALWRNGGRLCRMCWNEYSRNWKREKRARAKKT